MKLIQDISISEHAISVVPTTHVCYKIDIVLETGRRSTTYHRYSEFLKLHSKLRDVYPFPSKHVLAHALIHGAYLNQGLIAERKAALTQYLNNLNNDLAFQQHPAFLRFLNSGLGANLGSNYMRALDTVTIPSSVPLKLSDSSPGEEVKKPIVGAYYPSWAFQEHPPEKLDFSRFDILYFAFVTPNAASDLDWESGSQELLRRLVASARQRRASTKIVLSIGGWAGCHWFSEAVHSAANRIKLNNAIASAIYRFGIDGIDIDWEYPNSTGAGNPHRVTDTANFLKFIQLLRATLGSGKIISAAVPHLPWLGPNGQPSRNVAAFAKELSFVNIMNYDVFGASSKPGPNAPLGNLCGTSKSPEASAHAAVAQWEAAGFPSSKLMLGLPLYGYVSKSSSRTLSGSSTNVPQITHARQLPKLLPEAARRGDLSTLWGQQISFYQLLETGVIVKRSDGTYGAANGYTMGWDDCSDTPYLFHVGRSTVVTYDDTWSIESKCKFAKDAKLGGCFTWSLDQDDGYRLHDIVCRTVGKKN